jgi:hypothetical protein
MKQIKKDFDCIVPFEIPLLSGLVLLVVYGFEINSCFCNYFEGRGKKVKVKGVKLIDILKHTACPAILTENFFMDDESECLYLMSEEGRRQVANMHVAAIREIIVE